MTLCFHVPGGAAVKVVRLHYTGTIARTYKVMVLGRRGRPESQSEESKVRESESDCGVVGGR